MNKKRKFTKEFKVFIAINIFLLIIIIVLVSCRKDKNNTDKGGILNNDINNEVNNFDNVETLTFDINESSESDKEIVKRMFASGMSKDDFISVLNNKPTLVESNGNYSGVSFDFEKSLHYSDIEFYLNELNKSDIVNLYVIGKTHDNRNLYNIEIGKGDKVLLIDANMHAAEGANAPILTKFLIDIVNDYEDNKNGIRELLNTLKIAAIPCVNPDGYEVYNFGIESINNKDLWIYKNKNSVSINHFKYNANGVDLNRNFPTQSGGLYHTDKKLLSSVSLEKTTKRYTYFGESTLGSEPETRAVMYQMLSHYKDAYAYINLHSQGRIIYSGKPNLSDEYNDLTINLCKRIGKITNYKVYGLGREEVGEGNDGTASDFMAEIVNGLHFSTTTGRLSTTSYKNNSVSMKYGVPAIVVETSNDNYKDPKYYKIEYYNHGIKTMLYDLLTYGYELYN